VGYPIGSNPAARLEYRGGGLVYLDVRLQGFQSPGNSPDELWAQAGSTPDHIVFFGKRGESSSRIEFRYLPPDSLVVRQSRRDSRTPLEDTRGYLRTSCPPIGVPQ